MKPIDLLFTPLNLPEPPKVGYNQLVDWAYQETIKAADLDGSHRKNYPWKGCYARFDSKWQRGFDEQFHELVEYVRNTFLINDDQYSLAFFPVRPDFEGMGFWHNDQDCPGLRFYLENDTDDSLLIRPTVEPFTERPNFVLPSDGVAPHIQELTLRTSLPTPRTPFYINNARAIHAVHVAKAPTKRIVAVLHIKDATLTSMPEHISKLIVDSARYSSHALLWSPPLKKLPEKRDTCGVLFLKPEPQSLSDNMDLRKQIAVFTMFTPEECKKLTDSMNKNSRILSKVSAVKDGEIIQAVDRKRRVTFDTQANDPEHIKMMMNRIMGNADSHYAIETEFYEKPRLFIYPVGGHFAPHYDAAVVDEDGKKIKFNDRDYSVVVFLNDDYEGGEFYFPDFDLEIKPQIGQVIMFPADDRFAHGVRAVTKGNRYQMISWLTVLGSSRNHDEAKHGAKSQIRR